MEEKIVLILNEMSEYLSIAQMKKLQEVVLKTFSENEADKQEISNNDFLQMFLDAKRIEGCSERTIQYYRVTVEHLFSKMNQSVRRITTEEIRTYLSDYQKINRCSNVTIDNIRRNISSFFSWLEEEDYILKSPMKRIHKIKTKTVVKSVITDEGIEKLRDNCAEIRDLAIIDLLYSTGIRVGELVNLNIEDIDLEGRECIVYGKGDKERRVYFDAKAKVHLKEVASQDKTTYKIVPQGYFAYNPSRINVGSVDWQRYEKRVIVSPLYNVFSVSEGIDRQYLYYFLRSDLGRQMIKAKASGSVRDNLKLDMLKEMTIPDISVEQQKFCSSVLDKLHKLIQMRQQELQKLDEFIKARFVEMFGDVIHNSKKWQVCLFAEITSSRLGKMLDAKQQTGRNSYPYLANFNVQWFRFNLENLNKMDFDEKDRAEFELREGDLLVCEGGEIGRCAVWHNELQPCFFQKALHRVRCNHQIILPDYLAWWFRYNCDYGGFSALAGAKATIAHLPGAKLKQLQVAVPPMELQEQFAVFVAQTDKSKVAVRKY